MLITFNHVAAQQPVIWLNQLEISRNTLCLIAYAVLSRSSYSNRCSLSHSDIRSPMPSVFHVVFFVVLETSVHGQSQCATGYANTCCLNDGILCDYTTIARTHSLSISCVRSCFNEKGEIKCWGRGILSIFAPHFGRASIFKICSLSMV